jgi:hypothetical protein
MHLRRGLFAPLFVVAGVCLAGWAGLRAQADPRLTVQDIERVTGLKGVQPAKPGAAGAGPGLNFAGADGKMVLMVNFGTADLYRRARAQTEMKIGSTTMPMPLFHAALPGIGDEAFDSPPGDVQYVIYLRKGQKSASLSTYFASGGKKTILTLDQLKQLAGIVAGRL